MRSPTGPLLIVLGLATTVVLALLLFQVLGLRENVDRAREEVATLRASVEAGTDAVTVEELEEQLDALEADLRLEIAGARPSPGSGSTGGASGAGTDAGLADRIDEVLERITALDDRVDEICESVPVC